MYNMYEVKENDTLDSIARRFNIPYSDLIRNNNLDGVFELQIGQQLKVPVDNSMMFQLYKVKQGDTVYGIARKFSLDANVLLTINSLDTSSYIYPNQDLLVPRENVGIHITNNGDSLDTVMNGKNITLEELVTYNQKIYLAPNQVIIHRNRG